MGCGLASKPGTNMSRDSPCKAMLCAGWRGLALRRGHAASGQVFGWRAALVPCARPLLWGCGVDEVTVALAGLLWQFDVGLGAQLLDAVERTASTLGTEWSLASLRAGGRSRLCRRH